MEKEVRWSAPEFHYYKKSVVWYWLVMLIGLILIALALWQKNFLFALFIVMAAVLTIGWGRREPKTVDFRLSENGLYIGENKFYPHESLVGFAIVPDHADPELSELLLQTKGRINAWLRVIIVTQRTPAAKKLLTEYLPEIEYRESISEHLGKILRF